MSKKKDAKSQTKAGMMSEKRRKGGRKNEIEAEKDPAQTPKMSKDKAEEKGPDKPLH